MTAAYLAPDSTSGRRALLAAARAFAAQKQPDAAAMRAELRRLLERKIDELRSAKKKSA